MKIKRARGHRLYTTEGQRILDLSMDMGRAVIGHRPNGLSLTIKNSIDRGIYAAYDNVFADRLVKYLKRTFPEYNYISLLSYEEKITKHFNCSVSDPLFEDCSNVKLAYWRPFLETPNSDNLIILYPLPGLNTTSILLSKDDSGLKSDKISPVLLSGILRSLYDYDDELKSFSSDDYKEFKKIKNSTLKAPYLILKRDELSYKKLYADGLESGILLNETLPLIVLTNDFSKGEVSKVITLLNGGE